MTEITNLLSLSSPETERALLGCILIDEETLISLDITPNDFQNHCNRMVFEAIATLAHSKTPIDYLTVCGELDRRKQLAEIGGPSAVMELIQGGMMGHSWNAPTYAKTLRDKSRRRTLVQTANQIAQIAYNEQADIDAAVPGFINCLVNTASVTNGAQHISGAMSNLYDEVKARYENPQDIWGIPTGFPTFDKTTGGLQPGELLILAGTPGVGKSILGVDFAAGMAKHAPGAIYSLEMSKEQVSRRLVSGRSEVPTRSMKNGHMDDDQWTRFTQAIDYFSSLPVYIADTRMLHGLTTTSLRADLARLKAQKGIQWFLLDYLYLLNDGGEDEIERTAKASKGLKQAAGELDLAGIAIHSLNKAGMGASRAGGVGGDGLPNGLDDLRGSGQVAYDADLACFLTKYSEKALPDLEIPPEKKDITRVLWFGKGRELENPRQYVPLQQKAGFPAFVEIEERKIP